MLAGAVSKCCKNNYMTGSVYRLSNNIKKYTASNLEQPLCDE